MRRRTPRPARPAIDALERRDLMAGGQLGLNVSPEYVDMMKEATHWEPLAGYVSGTEGNVLTRNTQGWPTSDAQVVLLDARTNQWWNGPDPNVVPIDLSGTYHISFRGSSQIIPWAADFTVQNQVYNPSTNITTADLVEKQVGGNAWLGIHFYGTKNPESGTGKGITDVKLIRPGYAADTTQVFTTESLNTFSGFKTLRVIDAVGTNAYEPKTDASGKLVPVDWSQRRLPNDASQVDDFGGKIGQSWEYMVQLANTLDANLWVNIPPAATDDYVRQLSNLIKNGDTVGGVAYAGLEPGLKVYVEYSNEVWGGLPNPSNAQRILTQQELNAGSTPLNNDGTTDFYALSARFYLKRSAEISQIFRTTYGGDPDHDTVRPILAWQQGRSDVFYNNLPWFTATYGAPSQSFYSLGSATYFDATDYSSVDRAIASMYTSIQATSAGLAGYTAVARFYGLKNVAYEGGPGIGASPGTPEATVALATSRDPRMTAVVLQSYNSSFAAGVDEANYYKGLPGIWSPLNQWQAAEYSQRTNPLSAPKYAGLRAVLAESPVRATVGRPVSSTVDTPISRGNDDMGQNTSIPRTGSTNLWLFNVEKAGTYRLTLVTDAAGPQYVGPTVIEVLLNDRTVLGKYQAPPSSTIDLGSFALPKGLATLGIRNVRALGNTEYPDQVFRNAYSAKSLTISPVSIPPETNPVKPTGTASFVGLDTATGGSWRRSYGADGYLLAQGPTSLPSYATAAVSGQQGGYTWQQPSSESRALQLGDSRLAACWYSDSGFNVSLKLGTATRRVALYALDWDRLGRSQRVEVIDTATGSVLDSRDLSNFSNGSYLAWDLSGNVTLRVSNVGRPNAVISGIFFGGAADTTSAPKPTGTASYVGLDSATGGSWRKSYGADGYALAQGPTSLPSYASAAVSGQQGGYTWQQPSSESRALQLGDSRLAACWYSDSGFNVSLKLGTATRRVALYALDWDRLGRSQRVEVIDTATGSVLDSRDMTNFAAGAYLAWDLSGDVTLRVTNTGRPNAVISGIFFGGPASTPTGTASYVGLDTATGGSWRKTYGADGYALAQGPTSLPSYASAAVSGQQGGYTWQQPSSESRALQLGDSRLAACWYSDSGFNVSLKLGSTTRRVALYALDWDRLGRSQRVEVIDTATGSVLDSRDMSSFAAGAYLAWDLSGDVTLRVTNVGRPNAVISGIFFGGAADTSSPTKPAGTASFVGLDTATGGSWRKTYGADGYAMAQAAWAMPSYATAAVSGLQGGYTWQQPSSESRALQLGDSRLAACWYSNSVLNVNLKLGSATRRVALYALDWDRLGRTQRVEVIDTATGSVLDSRDMANFGNGAYLAWDLTGDVTLRVTNTGRPNAVISGIFLGGPASSSTAAASGASQDSGGSMMLAQSTALAAGAPAATPVSIASAAPAPRVTATTSPWTRASIGSRWRPTSAPLQAGSGTAVADPSDPA